MLNLITNFKLRNASSTKSIMKKIFLFTILLSFAFVANSCSDDDRPSCGCDSHLNKTVASSEGDLKITVDEYGNPIAFIRQGAIASFTVCNFNFVTDMNFEQDVNIPVIFSGKYNEECLPEGEGWIDIYPTYSIKLTQIDPQ